MRNNKNGNNRQKTQGALGKQTRGDTSKKGNQERLRKPMETKEGVGENPKEPKETSRVQGKP